MSDNPICNSTPAPTVVFPKDYGNYSDPTPEMLNDKIWNAIWKEIKHWDINVPSRYQGYSGATGNHVTAIYKAIQNAAKVTSGPCVSCGQETEWACADCRIDKAVTVYVCGSAECRDKHEANGCTRVGR